MNDFEKTIQRFNIRLAALDERLTARWGVADAPGLLRSLAILATRSGDGLPFLVIIAAIFLLGGDGARARVLLVVLGDVLTFIVIQILKFTVRRPRPEGEWGQFYRKTDPHSFPSGHSARGGVVAMTGLLMGPWWVGAGLTVWGLAVAGSRVVMGVHYVSDAAAGFAVGLAMGLLVSLLVVAL